MNKKENIFYPIDTPPMPINADKQNTNEHQTPKPVDPLPESTRPRKDGPGGDEE